ncbi:nitrite reductase small subunit NirD [Pantoea sp. BIGb0393]|uniref:Nitrite reductase small subunit NirD n=1 Tax=Pantoea nemavictus TaxID=2726955 RepID=A0ABU8PSU5_9GAMM|nr:MULTISPECIES: nitrite reductase small subunit NirD [Pantoea]EJL82967.1 NAD(P)H-dependent nitrite reductase, small subunit [Pantoea sp. GM01]MBA0036162.1 nitrite reductase small subunit NirD [Pantoea nemavictus]
MSQWHPVCELNQILPATGVCALVKGQQIAIFRPRDDEQLYALSNIDPFAQASVLSRGLIAEHQQALWVASPLKKQRFRLSDGFCLEDEARSVASYPVRVSAGKVEICA